MMAVTQTKVDNITITLNCIISILPNIFLNHILSILINIILNFNFSILLNSTLNRILSILLNITLNLSSLLNLILNNLRNIIIITLRTQWEWITTVQTPVEMSSTVSPKVRTDQTVLAVILITRGITTISIKAVKEATYVAIAAVTLATLLNNLLLFLLLLFLLLFLPLLLLLQLALSTLFMCTTRNVHLLVSKATLVQTTCTITPHHLKLTCQITTCTMVQVDMEVLNHFMTMDTRPLTMKHITIITTDPDLPAVAITTATTTDPDLTAVAITTIPTTDLDPPARPTTTADRRIFTLTKSLTPATHRRKITRAMFLGMTSKRSVTTSTTIPITTTTTTRPSININMTFRIQIAIDYFTAVPVPTTFVKHSTQNLKADSLKNLKLLSITSILRKILCSSLFVLFLQEFVDKFSEKTKRLFVRKTNLHE